jgi:hypothetical protein
MDTMGPYIQIGENHKKDLKSKRKIIEKKKHTVSF